MATNNAINNQLFSTAASIASATTTNIGAAGTMYLTITGTTTITAFDNVAAGQLRYVRFSGALTLTHNATSLILPNNGSNITTANGDTAIFVSEGSGNWRCLMYTPVSGSAPAGGGVTGFTGSQNTSSPNDTVNASRLLVSASSTNADFVAQPKGTGAILAQLPDSTATGGNKRGVRSVDLQMGRGTATQVVSGSDSFTVGNSNTVAAQYSGAIGYNNNINGSASYAFAAGSSNTAGSGFTVAMGYNNTATGQAAVSIGYSNTNSGTTGIAIGQSNTVSGTCSVAIGQQLTANGSYSVATNFNNDVNAKNYSFVMLRGGRLQNDYTFTIGSYRSTTGDGQATIKILHAATTNATPTAMTGSGGSATYAFPSGRNVSVIATIQAMDSSGNGGMFVRQALFSRTLAAQIGTTQTVGTDIVSGALSGISVALAYSSGNLNVNVTGLGATNIQWLCKLELTELQYS